ncbi:MAG: hypothetical protein K6T16_02290 [Candidatus Pacearchaeota archaeon]|nr:hypothetical protein [Candidatus Pacearchaeota archaeon]
MGEKRGKGKKGIGHLEMITAMLIFLFAVVFVVYIINISLRARTSEPVLDALEAKFREEAEINFTKTLLKINAENNPDCFIVPRHSDFAQETLMFITQNSQMANFNLNGDLLIENRGNRLYEIYVFPEDVMNDYRLPPGSECEAPDGGSSYSVNYHGRIFSAKRLSELDDREYEELKTRFNLGTKDFEIILSGDINIKIGEKVPPKKVEIEARAFPIEVMREDGEIVEAMVNMKIW